MKQRLRTEADFLQLTPVLSLPALRRPGVPRLEADVHVCFKSQVCNSWDRGEEYDGCEQGQKKESMQYSDDYTSLKSLFFLREEKGK